MLIAATCPQGHSLNVDESESGQPIRCPVCEGVFVAPEPVLQFVVSQPPSPEPPIVLPAPAPPVMASPPPREEALEDFPAVVFEGRVFAVATSYAEFCRGMAGGEPQAIEIALADSSKERVALAGFYAVDHGESMDAMRRIQRATLQCLGCRAAIGDMSAVACESCGGDRAYLLVAPEADVPVAKKPARKDDVDVPALLKLRRDERRQREQDDYRRVRWGVTCHLARQVMQVSLIVAMIAAALSLRFNVLLEYVEVCVLGGLLFQGVGAIGSHLCGSVPDRSYAGFWAGAALRCDLLGIAFGVGTGLVLIRDPHARMLALGLAGVSMLLGLGGWAMFTCFLAHLGKHLGHRREADLAAKLAPRGAWLLIAPLAAMPIFLASDSTGMIAAQILVIGLMLWFAGACWVVIVSVAACIAFRRLIGQEVASRETSDGQ